MDHFLMRGLGKCRGEFSLMTLSYNFKRVMNEPSDKPHYGALSAKTAVGGDWRVNLRWKLQIPTHLTATPGTLDREPELIGPRGASLPVLRCSNFPG